MIEWVRGVVQRLLAEVVFPLAIKRTVLVVFTLLVMLWVLVLAIQQMVVLGLVKLPLYRRQTLPSRQEWFALLGTHVNAPMISLNSRLYSLPEYEAG
ncbi:MAG TPA: hypothetical protein V6D35_11400 [Candidatus Sericytochromatia bacterium]